jgi:hypothetical protein
MTSPRKSASLTVFHFGDSPFRTLVQNAQVNLQHCIDDYDRSILLKEDFVSVGQTRPTVLLKPNMAVFLGQVAALAKEGYYIDLFIFAHGSDDRIYFDNDKSLTTNILKSELSFENTGLHTLPIRAVYQMNCYGQTFNETWLALGAKVTCGARYVNFYPNQFNKFASEWKKGDVDFAEALRDSNTESSRTVMQGLIAADALGKSNFDKCPFLKTVLGDHSCAQSYFHANWGISADEWQNGQSGADNMNYSSYMFRAGLKTLTRNNMTSLSW